jgi:hypothetical protein
LQQCFRKQKSKISANAVSCNGTLSEDRQSWRREVSNLYAGIYKDTSVRDDVLDPAARREMLATQRARLVEARSRCAGAAFMPIPLPLVFSVRAKFCSKPATAPGADGIGWDLLALLPDAVVVEIHRLFETRLNSAATTPSTEIVDDWLTVIVRLIPKGGDVVLLKNWRPISVSACLQKWYCSILCELLDAQSNPLSISATGFRRGMQPMNITETARLLLQRSSAWRADFCILKCDIRKAFDSLQHDVIVSCLQKRGAPPLLTHAFLNELCFSEMHMEFQETACGTPLLLASGGRQGAADTPSIWNTCIDTAWVAAAARWQVEGLGFVATTPDAPPQTFLGQFWADDMYLYGDTPQCCERMFVILSEEIQKLGFRWKEEELELLENGASNPCEYFWNSPFGVLRVRSVESMIVLGVSLDRQGRAAASISHRIQCAMGLWVNTREYFCSRRIPLLARFRRFYEVVGRCLLYGAGGWGVDKLQLQRIQSFERSLLVQMLCRHKLDSESWAAFETRRNAILANLWNRSGIQPLMCEVVLSYYGWAGHIARSAPESYIARALSWRSAAWFRIASLLPNCPKMSRAGRPVAWEAGLEKSFGAWWAKHCSDRVQWRIEKRRAAIDTWKASSGRPPLHSMYPGAPAWHSLEHISNRLASFPRGCDVRGMIVVDNLQVACQVKGVWQPSDDPFIEAQSKAAQWTMHALKMCSGVLPWQGFVHVILHLPRTQNSVADAAAFLARTGGSFEWRSVPFCRRPEDRVLLMCDASFKLVADELAEVNSGLGCAIFLYRGNRPWRCMCIAGLAITSRSSVVAEFEALNFGLYRLVEFLRSCALNDSGGGLP